MSHLRDIFSIFARLFSSSFLTRSLSVDAPAVSNTHAISIHVFIFPFWIFASSISMLSRGGSISYPIMELAKSLASDFSLRSFIRDPSSPSVSASIPQITQAIFHCRRYLTASGVLMLTHLAPSFLISNTSCSISKSQISPVPEKSCFIIVAFRFSPGNAIRVG